MRWLRRLVLIAAALLAAVLLVVAGALVFLHTERGGRLVNERVLGRFGESISGSLEVKALQFRGPRLHLTDVVLRDPEGEVVARIEAVDVQVGPLALFRKTIHIESLRLVRPDLRIVQDEQGTNLQRALEPREPKPEKAQKEAGGRKKSMNVIVEDAIAEGGRVRYEQRTGEGRTVALGALELRAELSMLDAGDRLTSKLDGRAEMEEPRQGPVELHANFKGQGERRTLDVDFSAAGAELRATAALNGAEDLQARVERLVLPPEVVRAFAPEYPLAATLNGEGTASGRGPRITGEAHLSAGSGRIDAKGDFDLDSFRSTGITLEARDVDLSELVPDGPKSQLRLTLEGRGGGRSLETAEGSVQVHAPQSRIGGSRFGPIRIDADASDGVISLRKLDVHLPGVALTASGHVTEQRVSVQGKLAAEDLAALGNTLGKFAGSRRIPMRGSGAATFRVTGPAQSPRVVASGRFPLLEYGPHRARDLRLELDVPDVRQPLAGNARVDLRASSAVLGDKRLRCPALAIASKQGALSFDARTGGSIDVALAARGDADPDGRGLTLRSVVLRYPEAEWKLERAARLRFDEGRSSVRDLALRSGAQRLAVDVEKTTRRVEASLQIDCLDLGLLPAALVDPELQLRGSLSLHASAGGRPRALSGSAQVALRDGRVREYRDLHLEMDASWDGGRARGTIAGSGIGVRGSGNFDLPLAALRTGRRIPVSADLAVDEFSVEQVASAVGQQLPLQGRLSGDVRLRGTARDPELRVDVRGRALVYENRPPLDIDGSFRTDDRGRLVARLDAASQGQPGFVALETPWTLGRLLRNPPKAEQVLQTPIALTAKFERFPIPLGEGNPTLDADVDLRGPALALRGKADVAVQGVQSGELGAVDGRARLALDATGISLDATLAQEQATLLRANGRVDGTLARMRDPKKLSRTRWALDAEWGPIRLVDLQRLGKHEPPLPGEDPAPLLSGVTRGTLKARGTLADPTVEMDAAVERLGAAESGSVGDVSMRYRYSNAVSALDADLSSDRGGRMTLRGRVPLDLSWKGAPQRVAWQRVPVEMKLEAAAFDPGFLSGVSPKLLRIGGSMDANVDVRGTMAVPDVQGRFEWKDGVLTIAGSGAYQAIHLAVHGTEERIVLEELTARAGDGSARITGEATREAPQQLRLAMDAHMKEFPLIVEDQLAATLSVNGDGRGTASLSAVDLELAIDEAHVELPPTARKELQQLKKREDVVFLRNGKPLQEQKTGAGGSGSAGRPDAPEIRVRVRGERNLWVQGDDLVVELGLDEGFQVMEEAELQAFGKVKVIRGRLEVFGKRFDLERDSQVTFTGPPLAPRVDVTAQHENKREDVTVSLHVTGTAQDLQMETSSEPPLSGTEIYTLLATGRRTLRPGTASSGSGNPAVSVLGGIAASQLKRGIEEVLPLDVLSIEPGERGIAGTRVEAGTYVGDRLYLGIQSQLGAQHDKDENHNQLSIEYQLSRRLMLELEYGDARQGSLDLFWRKQY